jgi:hypothetical protein
MSFFTSMPSIIIADINPVDPNDIPDFANQFFSNNDPNDQTPLFTFTNAPISPRDIIDATDFLQPKKSQDMNGISMSFIKNLIPLLATTLAHVFSCSLMTGVVLSQQKIAKLFLYLNPEPVNLWTTIVPFLS